MGKWEIPPKGGHMDLADGIYFQNMTMREVEKRLKKNDLIIIPVGSTECHGLHACYGEDTFLVTRMAEAVAKWPKTELRFIPSPSRYFRESQYQKNPEEWDRNGNGGSTKKQQRVTNNRKAILAGLGLSEQPRQSGAGVQDRDVPRRDSGMAKLLRD